MGQISLDEALSAIRTGLARFSDESDSEDHYYAIENAEVELSVRFTRSAKAKGRSAVEITAIDGDARSEVGQLHTIRLSLRPRIRRGGGEVFLSDKGTASAAARSAWSRVIDD